MNEEIDRYNRCPKCHHDWSAHFQMIDPGTEELIHPTPCLCMECGGPLCDFALTQGGVDET